MTATLAMQCTETNTGTVGDFLYTENKEAISPVFDHFGLMADWMRKNGWKLSEYIKGDFFPNRCVKNDA